MITTVTTTTVTTLAATASLAIVVIVGLLIILIGKEIIGAGSEKAMRVSKALNVAIMPLALVFGVTVLVKITEVFS